MTTARRDAILDAALAVATEGGFDAVRMRAVARRCGVAVGTVYRHFPSKAHMLVTALTREFERLDAAEDWAAGDTTPQQRLHRLTTRLHQEWQQNPRLTEAMTRAFVVADTTAAAATDHAATVIEDMLARALSGGDPRPAHRQLAGVIADIWLANLTAFIGERGTASDIRDRIDRAISRLVGHPDTPTERAGRTHQRYY
ncbi:TetR family transcriptional regulator [Mycolicibacterium elephantis]|nr:TetR family transcriptional regulator [Mycolicibacterium elephantis]